jgi:hypothetical protein
MSSIDPSIYPQSGALRYPLKEASLDASLQPDSVVPAQFYGARREGKQMEALKRLMCAILEDALRCFERNLGAYAVVRRREFREVENWLFRETKGEGPFSFENVCDALNVDPNRLRRVISERRANILAGRIPSPLSRRSPVRREASKSVLFGGRARRVKQTSGRGK